MKKFVIGSVIIKITLLGVFGLLIFNKFPSLQFAQVTVKTTPSPSPDDKIKRDTSNPFKGDLSKYDKENRAEKLKINRVMNILKITEGANVADIGAGGGWFSVIAAKRVGEKGRIYAVDINEDAIKYIDNRKAKAKITNIETVLGETDDPRLKKNSIDAVLILNSYHEIAEPIVYLKKLKPALKNGALLGIIDRDGDGSDHGIGIDTLIKEAKQAGFSLNAQYDFVEGSMDYFLVFEATNTNENERKTIRKQK